MRIINGKRRYGCWAGNPNGHRENPNCCAAEVFHAHSYIPVQCRRKRGHGPQEEWCRQHARRVLGRSVWQPR